MPASSPASAPAPSPLKHRPGSSWMQVWWPAAATAAAAAAGGAFALAGQGDIAAWIWGLLIAITAVPLVVEVLRELLRKRAGVDVVALLAMVGAIVLGEFLAGAIIALMVTGGRALEDYASARARRELTALIEAAPRRAHRLSDDEVVEVDVDEVEPGDRLVVRPGDLVPVDGLVASARAVLDETALTGEARPVERDEGERVPSGAVNAGGPFELRAAATAEDSTYRGIVRLVEQAQRERAPFVRMADRAAGFFIPVTLALAGGAWLISGDPVRMLAVLVVATPCPLILAAPIAITSGISRLARRGVIVKGGGALELLARTETVMLDKTGTVTAGRPRVLEVETFDELGSDEVLRLAASLDQLSAHVFAPSIVQAARDRGLRLTMPSEVHEDPGSGIRGRVDEHDVRVGRIEWVSQAPLPAPLRAVKRRTAVEGTSAVAVSVDGEPAGAILLDDPLRADAVRTVRGLRQQGVQRVVLLTGDHADVADLVGDAVDVDRVLSDRTPQDKVDAVIVARERGVTLMVGDGVNDAPALAQADIGVAMGARGATASSEAADVVVLVDRFDRVREGLAVAKRTRAIAWQSIQLGMGLSILAMVLAAAGMIPPVAGALLQEVIDVAAIANALRALGIREAPRARPELSAMSERLRAEHRALQSGVERLRDLAGRLPGLAGPRARADLEELHTFLRDELLPHEFSEEHEVYPVLADLAGDEDPTAPLRHTHREILRLTRLLEYSVNALPAEGPSAEDCPELQRLLYGLHAILRLHIAQEEEAFGILDTAGAERAPRSRAGG